MKPDEAESAFERFKAIVASIAVTSKRVTQKLETKPKRRKKFR
jgi:hypothetical protein